MSQIAKRIAAAAYVLGLVSAAVVWILFCAWLAPDPGQPAPRMAPITYHVNELAPSGPRETWEEYAARMEREGRKPVR